LVQAVSDKHCSWLRRSGHVYCCSRLSLKAIAEGKKIPQLGKEEWIADFAFMNANTPFMFDLLSAK